MWILDVVSNAGKVSSIQVAILMEFARSGDEPKKIPDLMDVLAKSFKDIWKPKKGTIYPAIHQLHMRGFLKVHAVQPYGYSITDNGKALIEEMMDKINLQMEAYMQYYTYILKSYAELNYKKAKKISSQIVETIKIKLEEFTI